MLNWYIEKQELKHTPSVLDGFDTIKEAKCRKEGARFIYELGKKLGLGCTTVATGIVYFQRFYLSYSFKKIPKYLTACCCLFLSGKVEETPKRAKNIIRTAKEILTPIDFQELGANPKEAMMMMENVLLKAIKFDFKVDHPYNFILKYAKCFKGEKENMEKLVQSAWIFINDSLCTTICLQWEPELIAIASLHLASKLNRFEINDWVNRTASQSYWWEVYDEGITIKLVEDIGHELLDMYTSKFDSPVTADGKAGKTIASINSKSKKKTVYCAESVTCKNKYWKAETSSLASKFENKDLNGPILNFVIPTKKRKILSDCNNVIEKPTMTTSTLKLNEDVWNNLKKIQVTGTTSTDIIHPQNILFPCYYNKTSLNLKDTNFKLGGLNDELVNSSYETTDIPLSQSNNNHISNAYSSSFTHEPLLMFKHSVSTHELVSKTSEPHVSQTLVKPSLNMYFHSSYQNKDLKEINYNNMNHVPLLPTNLQPESAFHRSTDSFFPYNSNLICSEFSTENNSFTFSNNSLLQTAINSPQEHSVHTMLTNLQHPLYPPQDTHSVSGTAFQSKDYAVKEAFKNNCNASSTSTEPIRVSYAPENVHYLVEQPSYLEQTIGHI